MKKTAVAVTAAVAMFSAGMAQAASGTIIIGYAQTHILRAPQSVTMPGVNVKYNWESDQRWGIIGSLAYTAKNMAGGTLTGVSLTTGPSFRFNKVLKAYLLAGGGYGRIDAGNDRVSASGVTYGAGLQVNPQKNIAIDASYVYTSLPVDGSVSINAGTWMPGVGYRF